jgi:ABC-2 type transport system ATP-binding protein
MTLGIEVRDLRLRYGDTEALRGLTFDLAGGKIYGLLGRNGSGKTSLLSVLAGFRKPSGGSVRVEGRPVFEHRPTARQICLIRESGDVGHKGDNIKDTLAIPRALRPTWDDAYAMKLVGMFGLPLNKKISELSRGQRSAFGIVVGLASRTPVTMFDESHLGMDAPSRMAFQEELLRDFMAYPRTIVISTHLIEEHSPLFERVLIIDQGRLLLEEDLDDLRARGTSVTGPADIVDDFVVGLTVLGEQRLGPTKSAMVYGHLDDAHIRAARVAGLELGPVGVQDLFVHLTKPPGGDK